MDTSTMNSQSNFDHLIDSIYDAGASPEQWPSVLCSIASAAGAQGGVVFGFSNSRGLVFEYNGALDPHCADIFKSRHTNNAWVQGMAQRPKNQLVVSDSLIRRRRLMQTDFYDEVLKPQQIAHGALATLTAGNDIEIQFSVQKLIKYGTFNTGELTTLRRLLPHVRRAMGVSLRLAPGHHRALSSAITDLFGCAAFTLNAGGETVEANARARQLALDGSLPLSRSGLRLSDPSEHRRFIAAVREVQVGAALRFRVLTQGPNRFEYACAALDTGKVLPCGQASMSPGAVLVLLSATHNVPAPGFLGAKRLTSAEWRVANAAASGISNAEIARNLDVSLNTVKTHLRRVYLKLDVRRQSGLIILLNRTGQELQ
jgi:DNA-binding CsgD family transcriptional regulator